MKIKRILAVALAAALLLAAVPALNLTTKAAATEWSTGYGPGLNYGGYSNVSEDWMGGLNEGYGYRQNATDIVASGYFNRGNPHATWQIVAPEAGEYAVRVWTSSDAAVKSYAAMLVNDKTAVTTYTDGGDGAGGGSHLNFTLTLEKGMNIVRFLPLGNTSTVTWCDIGGLDVDNRLTVVPAKDSGVLTVNASDAHYITNWGAGESYVLQDLWRFIGAAAGINADNWNYSNFSSVPSYSYAINVPTDGYYDIKVGYSTGLTGNTPWQIMVRVDDTNYTKKFELEDSMTVNASLYLTAGQHIISFSSAMDSTGAYRDWYNPTNVTFYGGITLATPTRDPAIPTGRPDSVNTYVPEDGYLYTFGLESWDWGSTVYGLGGSNQGVPHTVDTIQAEGYLNKRDLPYAALVVDAPQDGTYYLYPKLSGSISGITLVASANDADYVASFMIHEYTNCPYNHTGHDGESTFFNDSVVELAVNLKAGRNVIRLLLTAGSDYQTAVADNANPYTAISRICVDNRLTVVRDDALTLKPGQSSYYHLWESNGQSLWNVGGGFAVMNVDGWKGPNLTDCPYFSFTVDVPKDGYYDIDLKYATNPERTQAGGYEGYVVVNVDGTNYKCGMDCSTGGGAGVMNASVPLSAGTHVLTFSSFVRGSDNLVLDWFDVTDLTIHGGVTLANEQVNPAGNVCAGAHTYDDCMDGTCNLCGYLRTPSSGHSFSGDCDAACNNDGCGYTREVTAEHTGGTADCLHKAVCEVCHEEYGELGDHRGGDSNCLYKAVCEVCGEEYGELGAHNYENGECTLCGAEESGNPGTGDTLLSVVLAAALTSLAGLSVMALLRKRFVR